MGSISAEPEAVVTAADMPVIDFQALSQGSRTELTKLDRGFSTYGFVYLANHSIPIEMVDQAFEWSRKLFALPVDVKRKAKHPKYNVVGDHRGYCEPGIGHTTQLVFEGGEIDKSKEDRHETKETFETGNPEAYSEAGKNIWIPEEDFPGFKDFHERWWKACANCSQEVLRAFGHALELEDADLLCKMQSKNDAHVSLMYYPQMPIAPLKSRRLHRLNEHTDYGDLTLLFQDQVGGLEVHDGTTYRPIVPKRGTIVLNVGDMLERQTNGRWKSALHKVSAPTEEMMMEGYDPGSSVVDRYALVYFGQPNPDVVIDVLPGLEGKAGKWQTKLSEWAQKPTCFEWLQKRYNAEFYGHQVVQQVS